MQKEYSWSVGWSYGDATKIGQELETIGSLSDLTAENVVEYARNHTNSELHSAFEWDDAKAGEMWRKKQASGILTSIRVKIIDDDDDAKNIKPVRAFVQTIEPKKYDPIEVVVQDINKYQVLLEKAYKELNRTKEKYADLSEIQELLKDLPEM